MENDLITVIVPVFNSEKTLDYCLSSIASQTYRNLQILIIDDGSTDASLSISRRYANADKRFRVVHTKNKGVSAARNLALSMRSGEFVAFVDSDDVIHPRMLERLIFEAKIKKADIVFCKVTFCDYANIVDDYEFSNCVSRQVDVENFFRCVFSLKGYVKYGQGGGYLCNKLFKSSVIGDSRLVDSNVAEDEIFIVSIAKRVKKIIFVDEFFYFYIVRNGSLSRKSDFAYNIVAAREMSVRIAEKNKKIYQVCKYGYIASLVWLFDELNRNNFLSIQGTECRDVLRKKTRRVLLYLCFTLGSIFDYFGVRDVTKIVFCSMPFVLQKFIYRIKKVV